MGRTGQAPPANASLSLPSEIRPAGDRGQTARTRSACGSSHISGFVVYTDDILTETRYLVPAGADWAAWDDANGVLGFLTDVEVIEIARENERELGEEFGGAPLPREPTPEEAWTYIRELWAGDPGGRIWQVRVPAGATWVALVDDEDEPGPGGPEPVFGFGEPPLGEGTWGEPGY